MQIFVRTVMGATTNDSLVAIDVKPSDTVEILKAKVQEKEGTPADLQRIIFEDKNLEDERLLSDYKIYRDSTLIMVLNIRGMSARIKRSGLLMRSLMNLD